jgi:hypothetical protein
LRDETEVNLKRAYWSGVYHGLDPEQRHRSEKTERAWLTAEVWLAALNWVLGRAGNSASVLRPMDAETDGWDS